VNAPAKTNLVVEIDADDLTLGRFQQITQSLSGLVREVGEGVAKEHREPVRWVVSDLRRGSAVLELTPQRSRDDVPPDLPDRIADVIASGMALIEKQAERPAFFSDKALERARDLASPVGNEVRAVRIRRERAGKPTERVTVTKRLAANVEEIIGGQVESFGTVEGRLEGIVVHGRQVFYIWEALTNRRVECNFGNRIALDDVLAAFGKRVAARGIVRRRKTGEPVTVEVNELRVFPAEDELPGRTTFRGLPATANERPLLGHGLLPRPHKRGAGEALRLSRGDRRG
jgi:hypothetical protein